MGRKTEQKVIKNLYSGVILTLMAAAVVFSLFLMSGARAESKIYYVTVNGGATLRDGSSWENAFPAASLDYALTECSNNTDKGEVRAAKGLYTRKATLKLPKGVKLTGGWDTDTDSRDITKMMANPMSADCATILSRDASVAYMSIVTGGTGALSNDTCIDGFTITGGTGTKPDSTGTNYYGGGMYNSGSSPTVTNCSFGSNSASGSNGGGGGMYNTASSPTVTNCSFNNNSASGASGNGGGMFNNKIGANPTVINCTFSNNAASCGGGMFIANNSRPTVTSCSFSGNSASTGGGVYIYSSNPLVTNCSFGGNSASGSNIMYGGGGMYTNSGSPTVTNCTFSGNSANFGGGINNMNSSLSIINCTFSDNSANCYGGGICKSMGGLVIANSVIWGNKAATLGGDIYVGSGATTVRSSVLGSTSGTISTDGSVLSADPMIVSVDKDMKVTANSKDVCIYIISGDNVQSSSALGEGLPVGTYQIYSGTKSVDIVIPSKDGLGQTRSTNYVDIGAYQYAATTDKEVYGITLSQTSADLEIGQSVSFDITTKPINNSVLSAENSYADVSVSGKTVTLTAKTKTNGKKTIAVKATYGAGGHVSSADFTLTVTAKSTPNAEVTEETRTDRDSSGVRVISKDTAEDLAIYDSFAELADKGALPAGISVSADAIQAKSLDVKTDEQIYTSDDIKDAIARYWNLETASKDKVRIVQVQNTITEEGGSIFAKFWRFIVSLFTNKGGSVNDSDYLPLQTNFTITSADIAGLPDEIKDSLTKETLLSKINLFAVVSEDGKTYARSLNDISKDKLRVYGDSSSGYTVKTQVLLFNMKGGVKTELKPGAKWVQAVKDYFIVQDGAKDDSYSLCMAFAAKETNYASVTVTTDGVLPEASSDFTITGENGNSKNVTSQSVWSSDIISEDTYTVTYKNISGYTLTLSDDTKIVSGDTEKLTISKDIKWGQTWNVTATYRYKPVTAITVTPKELSFDITGPTDVRIKTITYEAAAELFISSDKWETAGDIISIDKTTGKTTTVTAKPVKNAGRASQEVTITVTGKDGTSTTEKATVWVTNAYIVKAGETLTISKDTMLYSLEIEAGGTVTISNDAKLSITDTMNAAQDSHINLDGNSSIEVLGKATGKPTVTVTNSSTINIKTGEGSTITYPETIVSGDKYSSGLVVANTKIVKSLNTIITSSLDLYVTGDETSGYKPNITPASFDEQLNVKSADIKGLYVTEIQATEQDDNKTYVISLTLTSRDIPVRADKTGLLHLAKLTADGTYTELLRVKELNLLSDGRWLIKSQGKVLAASDPISGDEFELNIGVKDNGFYDRNPKSHDVVDPAVLFCDGTYKDDTKPETHRGSSGCSTGLSSLSLLAVALLPFAAKKRER